MPDIYDPVASPKKRARAHRERLVYFILIAAVFFLVNILLIVYLATYNHRVWDFRSDLSESTVYAYENDCLRADVDGQAIRVTGEHIYDVYQFMCVRGLGRDLLYTPRGEPVTLDYGDGALLRMWPDKEATGMYIRFDAADGRRYRFHSFDMRLNDVVSRYLSLSQNTPWE